MKEQIFSIQGMTCAACSRHVERTTRKLTGTLESNVNLATEKLAIKYDEAQLSDELIMQAIEKAGYKASIYTPEIQANASDNKIAEMQALKLRLQKSALYTIPLLIISMGHMIGYTLPDFIHPDTQPLTFALAQLLLTTPVVWSGMKFFTVGLRTLFNGNPNMDSLIAIGTGSAYLYGIFAVYKIIMGEIHFAHMLYFESAAVILTLITMGKYLESSSKGKTSAAIEKLMGLAPRTARIEQDGKETIIPVENLQLEDIIIIKPGEKMPADGIVIEGTTAVDESMLTGESLPVIKQTGDTIISASINKNGSIKYRATKVGENTTLAQIIKLVENAQGSKAPIAQTADTISGYFVPIVITLSIISTIFWYIKTGNMEFSLGIFIAVLVIACPCALGLATPTAIMVAIGKGAELGILIKSGQALETAQKITAVVLDKTGTITQGKPVVTDIIPVASYSQQELLLYAASAERFSEHPLGDAIIQAAQTEGLELLPVENFIAKVGMGISLSINSLPILVGNIKLMKDNNISLDELPEQAKQLALEGKTPIYIAINSQPAGIIAVADPIKPDAAIAISKLRQMGMEPVMITGDNRQTALAIAQQAGIDQVLAEVLPSEKASAVESLQQQGKIVAMVGDGINDAPALAQADVGIAIGSGTDVALEAADIVLINNSLLGVYSAIELSKQTVKIIKQNLFWAFAYNIMGIPVAMGLLHLYGGPLLNPMIAGAAMSTSSVSVVSNALRLRSFKPTKSN